MSATVTPTTDHTPGVHPCGAPLPDRDRPQDDGNGGWVCDGFTEPRPTEARAAPRVERGDVVPGGLIVVAVESVGPGSVEGCWDCGRALVGGEVVVRVCELAAPEERYVLHRHCVELRYQDRPRYVPVREHDEALVRVGRAMDALAELNVPGGEFEGLIDELADAFGALRALVES